MPEDVIKELESFLNSTSLWRFLIVVILISYILKRVWLSLPFVKSAIEIFMNLQLLPKMNEKLEKVHHEVFPNSGKSLRDAVDDSVKLTKTTNAKIDKVAETVEDHHVEQTEIKKLVEGMIITSDRRHENDGS